MTLAKHALKIGMGLALIAGTASLAACGPDEVTHTSTTETTTTAPAPAMAPMPMAPPATTSSTTTTHTEQTAPATTP